MPDQPGSTAPSAKMGGQLGVAAAAFALAGVASAASGVLPAFGGFLVMVLGLGLALVGLVTSIVGVLATAPGRGRAGRSLAARGLVLSTIVIVALAFAASRGRGLPRINDITTSTDDPPAFVAALEHEANRGRDMAYPGETFAVQQQAAYPDLATLVVEDAPDVAYDKARAALASLPRVRITGESREEGRLEATETSRLFRFEDDVVVRVRPFQDGGSRIDVRSKSRDGKGDLGVNAARIRTILSLVRGPSAPAGD